MTRSASNFGFGGLGLRGTGRGGGGTGEGTIGLGNLGTIGHGGGGGYGLRLRPRRGWPCAAARRGCRGFVPATPTFAARSRSEVIRRVIRRHINEVRFCYEQELNQRPDLEGRVMVSFIISPTGAVQSAAVGSSTINNARVEGCITQAVRRWTFPAPDGGGVVGVNYPFVPELSGRLDPSGTLTKKPPIEGRVLERHPALSRSFRFPVPKRSAEKGCPFTLE